MEKEFQFLKACCQVDPTASDIDFIANYLESSSLDTLPTFATKNGLVPLLYTSLKKIIESQNLEPQTQLLKTLKKHYLYYVQNNMLMTTQLLETLKLLETNGVQALAFKGPTLAIKAYGSITLRQYVDLDILVNEADVFKAAQLLKDHGHTTPQAISLLSKSTYLNSSKDFSLFKQGVHTELHWRLFEKKFNIPLAQCLNEKQCQELVINQQSITTLDHETLLVYLCLHGSKHSFERLEWVCDIDRFIRNADIDWSQALAIATKAHCKQAFLLGLALSQTLFHTPLPRSMHQECEDEDTESLLQFIIERISSTKSTRSDFKKNYDTFRFQSKLFDSKKQVIFFQLSTFFKTSTTDCHTFNLPNRLKFLYIFLRPVRLLTQYFSKLFHSN